jgi:hypothetical protein
LRRYSPLTRWGAMLISTLAETASCSLTVFSSLYDSLIHLRARLREELHNEQNDGMSRKQLRRIRGPWRQLENNLALLGLGFSLTSCRLSVLSMRMQEYGLHVTEQKGKPLVRPVRLEEVWPMRE